MNQSKTKIKNYILIAFSILFASGVFVLTASASTTSGTIDSTNKYTYGENVGWINFGSSEGNVHITDSALTGYAWGENIGWINLNCSNDDSCSNSDYKIANDGEGNLTGYAYGENAGWVNFNPTNGGVTIDENGEFSGYAWGENVGWIIFNCSTTDTCNDVDFKVTTDWRPESQRSSGDSAEESSDDSENDLEVDSDDLEENSENNLEVDKVKYTKDSDSITVKWKTNHNAESKIRYGDNQNLEQEKKDKKKRKTHKITLKDLQPNTWYYFRIKCTDNNDNVDRSRIYKVRTETSQSFWSSLIPSGWQDIDNAKDDYEKVEIKASDKEQKEEDTSSYEQEFETNEVGKIVEKDEDTPRKPGIISRTLSKTKQAIFSPFNIIYTGTLAIKDKITELPEQVAILWANLTQKREKQYFTTQVSKKENKKIFEEIRFQLLNNKLEPLAFIEATLSSEPQTSISGKDGIIIFKEVEADTHTLAFAYEDEQFKKEVEISEPATEAGIIRAEILPIKAGKQNTIPILLWIITLIALPIFFWLGIYIGKKKKKEKI